MKLTLISVTYRGHRVSAFINVPYQNGKAIVAPEVYDQLAQRAGAMAHGATYTLS